VAPEALEDHLCRRCWEDGWGDKRIAAELAVDRRTVALWIAFLAGQRVQRLFGA